VYHLRAIIALMMEAAGTSDTSVNFCQTARRNTPENNHLHTRRHEVLKSHILFNICNYECNYTNPQYAPQIKLTNELNINKATKRLH
jgi:hypothetical protein